MTEPRDILEALFVGDEVERALVSQTAQAARNDDEVRELFDRLAVADRETGGDFEVRFGEAWFLDSLDTMLAEEEAEHEQKVVSLDSRRARFAPLILAAAAAVALGFGVLGSDMLNELEPEFQARSAATIQARTYLEPSVELFCVKRTGNDVEFIGTEQAELATVRCAIDQEIKIAVRNPDERLRYAAFFGVSDSGLYWYGPSPAAPAAIEVRASKELRPIGETIRLDVNHEPGTVRLVGVFAEEPLEFSELEEWTTANAQKLSDGEVAITRGVVVRQTFEVTQ